MPLDRTALPIQPSEEIVTRAFHSRAQAYSVRFASPVAVPHSFRGSCASRLGMPDVLVLGHSRVFRLLERQFVGFTMLSRDGDGAPELYFNDLAL